MYNKKGSNIINPLHLSLTSVSPIEYLTHYKIYLATDITNIMVYEIKRRSIHTLTCCRSN